MVKEKWSAEDWTLLGQEGTEMEDQPVERSLLVEEEEEVGQEWKVPAVKKFAQDAHIREL